MAKIEAKFSSFPNCILTLYSSKSPG